MTIYESLAVAAPSLGVWVVLWDVLILLTMAMVLGNLAERLGQSVIVGYLIAGTLVGPNALAWISTHDELLHIAEIGVALLLFAIGLEFSPRRLLTLGPSIKKVGPAQVVVTTIWAGLAGVAVGLGTREALVVGMMVAMSSTACVLRLLTDRGEVETVHGRSVLGILLVQDVAVVPMILLASVMATGGSIQQVLWKLAAALLAAIVLLTAFYVLFSVVAPRLFLLPTYRRNRDLPVLLAVIMATGSAWATNRAGLSPALGAFAAGILLATSPFAIQIRADVRPLMTLMVTLFFAAIGLFGDPAWLAAHWTTVSIVVLGIVVGKPVIIAMLSAAFGNPWRYAVATGLCLAQVGEFSFVLATIAQSDQLGPALITPQTFRTLVSATIVSLLLTPYFVAAAPRIGGVFEDAFDRLHRLRSGAGRRGKTPEGGDRRGISRDRDVAPDADTILLIGYGSVGRRVAQGLPESQRRRLVAIDLHPERIQVAKRYGLKGLVGDATRRDILDHAGIHEALAIVISVRDHVVTRQLIHLVRDIAPDALIVARCHYHVHYFELLYSGAHKVIDEEDTVGGRMASELSDLVGSD